jgi:uncharacterized protein (DUF433 family)
MAAANDIIVKDRDVLGGTPVFRGTRVPFQTLLDYLEGGQTLDEFLDDFPTVTRDAAVRALEQAKSLLVSQLR